MKTKTLKKIGLIFLAGILVITGLLFYFNYQVMNQPLLAKEQTLIEKQNEITKQIQAEISSDPKLYNNPFEISPLTSLITFTSEEPISVNMTIKGQHGSKDISQEFEASSTHYLPVYGLYPDTNNQVIINYGDQEQVFNIQTDPLPDDFLASVENITYDQNYQSELMADFYFLTPASKGYTSAYDINGNVRWYLSENLVWEIRYLENGNLVLSNEKIINPPYYTTGFYEMSMSGKIFKEYIQPGGYHHDLAELPNGNFLVASSDFENFTVEDIIVEQDRTTGEIVKTIDLKEILDTESGKSENWIDFDWFHNNSVWYDEPTNSITLSGRHQDIVVNIDYDSLEINYIVGNPDTFSADMQKYFLKPTNDLEWPYAQHAAKILPNGNLFIFDNGINRSKNPDDYLAAQDNYSRGVIYEINQADMTIKQVFEYGKERGSDYFSSYISDVDYLGEDHYLIHSGGVAFLDNKVLNAPPGINDADRLASYTSEVKDNKLIFELELNQNYYRAQKMNIYNSNQSLNMDLAESLGGLNSTIYFEAKKQFIKPEFDQAIIDQYDIKVSNFDNRVSLSGEFDKTDNVKVVLYKNYQTYSYLVRLSERPYTAMCIIIFDDGTQRVEHFINDDNRLKGEYLVLFELNGKLYSSGHKVDFKP